MVTVAGVALRHPDAAAVLAAVQDPTILGGAHAAVGLVASWWTEDGSAGGRRVGASQRRSLTLVEPPRRSSSAPVREGGEGRSRPPRHLLLRLLLLLLLVGPPGQRSQAQGGPVRLGRPSPEAPVGVGVQGEARGRVPDRGAVGGAEVGVEAPDADGRTDGRAGHSQSWL